MDIRITVKRKQGRITLHIANQLAGELRFSIEHKYTLRAYSTEVSPEHRGQHIGKQLVDALCTYCTTHRYILVPECSYISRTLARYEPNVPLSETTDESLSLVEELRRLGSSERAEVLQRFFRTAPGQYGHGDIFLGIDAPTMSRLYREVRPLSTETIVSLWSSPLHEARALGYQALVDRMRHAEADQERHRLYTLYIEHRYRCNNWDLVDCSAPDMLGIFLSGLNTSSQLSVLQGLASEDHLWTQRIAIVGTFGLIRRGIYEPTLVIAERLIDHPHDLIHKAVGWMLREVGKRIDTQILLDWLDIHATRLPRTALRYAIERLSPEQRRHYMTLR